MVLSPDDTIADIDEALLHLTAGRLTAQAAGDMGRHLRLTEQIDDLLEHRLATGGDQLVTCPECWPVVLIDPAYDQPLCEYAVYGYPYCPRCQDHHRPWPDCPGVTVDEVEADQRRADVQARIAQATR